MINALSGNISNKEFFNFYEDQAVNMDKIFRVLRGELAGSIFRAVIPSHVCEKIEENFWKSPFLVRRSDEVPASYIGTYHYRKELKTYFKQATADRKKLNTLFEGTDNIFNNFISNLTNYLKRKGICLRLAEHDGESASSFRISSWPKDDRFAIKPHDDLAQCKAVIQKGFEIQNVKDFEIIAVNICLVNDEQGNEGRLNYWNIQPNDSDRRQLGIEESGYPYPPEYLHKFDQIEIPIYKGDLYIFNGRNVHGVGPITNKQSNRVTMQFFMGFINNNTIIYWV